MRELQEASPNRFRGIRSHTGYDSHPEIESRAPQGRMANANFRAGAQVLARKGLVMDITAYFHQAGEMAAFAKSDAGLADNFQPHRRAAAGRALRGPGTTRCWPSGASSIDTVAACPNIYMKLGGVGQPRYGFDWHEWNRPIGSAALAEALGPLMNYCIEKFGPERCMFREQLPGGQGFLFLQRAVQRLQAAVGGLFVQRARCPVPRHGRCRCTG